MKSKKRISRSKKSKRVLKAKSFKFLLWLIPLILILGFIFYGIIYVNALNHLEIEQSKITSIKDFSGEGFTLNAKVIIKNPSNIDLSIKRIDYTLRLNDFKEEDTLNKVVIPSKSSKTIRIKKHVTWGFTLDLIKDILMGKETTLKMDGTVIIMETPLIIDVPFHAEFDLSDELTDLLASKTSEGAKDLVDDITDAAKDAVDDVVDFFS